MGKNLKKILLISFLFLIIIFFEFRDLIFNIKNSFINWGDSPFIAWQITITRDKILNLDFSRIPTTNSHYPFKNSLFFTDTFIGQAIMGLPLFFIKNPVLLHNLIFLITIFLNYLTSFIFFGKVFKSPISGILGSIFLNNSFYFFDQIIHLQTICFWPMILNLYFLFKLRERKFSHLFKTSFLVGIISSFQFYLSVYLAIFNLSLIIIFHFFFIFYSFLIKDDKIILISKKIFLSFLIINLTFAIFSFPLIYGYLEFQKTYHQIRDLNEIIQNSGQLTDYFFFLPNTFFANLPWVKKYNQFCRFATERVSFPGFVLFFGSLLGIFFQKIRRKKEFFNVLNQINFLFLFFFILILIGFIFSLGPRMMANGKYLEIPLPYLVFLNEFEFLHSIRLTHRWALFLVLGLTYFATFFYSSVKKYILLFFIMIIFLLESIPQIKTESFNYFSKAEKFLTQLNEKDKVLMEYPFLNLEKGVEIKVETGRLLASVYHKMKLFNGYTGIFINDYGTTRIIMEKYFPDEKTVKILSSLNIDYLKIDKKYLKSGVINKAKNFLGKPIYEDEESIIFKIKKEKVLTSLNDINVGFFNRHDYGDDKKLYINLYFKNKNKKNVFSNIDQKKIILKLNFYRNNKLIKVKEVYQLYPLIINPLETKKTTLQLYEKAKFDKLKVDIFDENNTYVTAMTSIF